MDGRDSIALPGSSSSYYLHRGVNIRGPSPNSSTGSISHTGLHNPPGFRAPSNTNLSFQSSVRDSSDGSAFPMSNMSPPNFPHSLNISVPSGVQSGGEPVKKKRGRPRKYGPDGTNMALGLSPMSGPTSTPRSGSLTPTEKKNRGRPRGSGWKQKLAPLGEWMNSSAGLAFAPHVIHVEVGEDIAAKILSFSQQRPRALCVMTGNGAVSAVTLRQPTSPSTSLTFEGRFQILCLSGSYLVAETGGRNRTGGISVSLCSPDGHVIGGGVSELIAASPVQVVVCSFVYGAASKSKTKAIAGIKDEEGSGPQLDIKPATPSNPTSNQSLTQNSSTPIWPITRSDIINPQRDIDLTRG